MANTNKCEDCGKYYKLERPLKKGGVMDTKKGHCLQFTIYAKGKPGHRPYPPRSKVEKLPYDRHKIHLVSADQVVATCTHFEES